MLSFPPGLMAQDVETRRRSENMPLKPFATHLFKTAFPISRLSKNNPCFHGSGTLSLSTLAARQSQAHDQPRGGDRTSHQNSDDDDGDGESKLWKKRLK